MHPVVILFLRHPPNDFFSTFVHFFCPPFIYTHHRPSFSYCHHLLPPSALKPPFSMLIPHLSAPTTPFPHYTSAMSQLLVSSSRLYLPHFHFCVFSPFSISPFFYFEFPPSVAHPLLLFKVASPLLYGPLFPYSTYSRHNSHTSSTNILYLYTSLLHVPVPDPVLTLDTLPPRFYTRPILLCLTSSTVLTRPVAMTNPLREQAPCRRSITPDPPFDP